MLKCLCHELTKLTDVVRELPAYIEDAHIVIIPYPRAFSNFMFNVPGDTIIIIYFSQLKYIIYNRSLHIQHQIISSIEIMIIVIFLFSNKYYAWLNENTFIQSVRSYYSNGKIILLVVLPHAFTLRWSNLRYIHSFEIFIQAEE